MIPSKKIPLLILAAVCILLLLHTSNSQLKRYEDSERIRNVVKTSTERFEDVTSTEEPRTSTTVSTTSTSTTTTTPYYLGPEVDLYSKCQIDSSNNITTEVLPHAEILNEWSKGNETRLGSYDTPIYLTGAYVYHDHLAVLFTSQNLLRRTVYCHYYDCHKKEIAEPFETIVFPETTALCARRKGADYVSLTFELDEKPQVPVRIVDRTKGYEHEFTVCAAPIHGSEPKWIQILDFIEYYKLMGATKIFLYVIEIDAYTQLLLNDYLRTGEVDITYPYDNYFHLPFTWHRNTIYDCNQKNKYYSKWTAFIDLDERITMNSTSKFPRIVDLLRAEKDPSVISHDYQVQWVKKTEDMPPRYINESHLMSELLYKKYTDTSQLGAPGVQPKSIVRPDKIGSMFIHYPNLLFPGTRRKQITPDVGYLRHYRETKGTSNKCERDLMLKHEPFYKSNIDPVVDAMLTKAIVERAKFVYEKHPEPDCPTQQELYQRKGRDAPCWKEYVKLNATFVDYK